MGCRHCVFGHENVDCERQVGVKAPLTINGARRSILWSVLSRDDVSQLLLPAAAFCSDGERSFERLSEVVERDMIQVAHAHVAVIRDGEVTSKACDGSSEPQLTRDLLQKRGAASVSQFVFKGGELVFVGSECFDGKALAGPISAVISYSRILSRTISDEHSHTRAWADLLRVLARFSSFSHVTLAPDCCVMFRASLPPTMKCCNAKVVLSRVLATCAGEFCDAGEGAWGLGQLQVFHALSDRKIERTVVAQFRETKLSAVQAATGAATATVAPSVQQLSPTAFKAMAVAGAAFQLVDVRNSWEFEIASIPAARLLDACYRAELMAMPRDTNLVFTCHHGIRSQYAAQDFLDNGGFRNVFNLEGGIDAWSELVDSSVPRY